MIGAEVEKTPQQLFGILLSCKYFDMYLPGIPYDSCRKQRAHMNQAMYTDFYKVTNVKVWREFEKAEEVG